MTMDDIMNIMELLQHNLPSGNKTDNERGNKLQVMAWHHHLKEVPYDIGISVAMETLGDVTVKFMPTIGEFKAKIMKHLFPEIGELSPMEAWTTARRKIGAWGRDRQEIAYSEMDEPTISTIESFGGWRKFCDLSEETETIAMSNRARFIESYKIAVQRQMESATQPESFAKMLSQSETALNELQGGVDELSAAKASFITPDKIRAANERMKRERGVMNG